jgi:hypothetical protein
MIYDQGAQPLSDILYTPIGGLRAFIWISARGREVRPFLFRSYSRCFVYFVFAFASVCVQRQASESTEKLRFA